MNFACDDGSELQNTLINEDQSQKSDYQPVKLDHDLTKIIKKTTELPHCQDQSTDDLVFSKKKDKHRRRQARKREREAAELTQSSSSTNNNKNPFLGLKNSIWEQNEYLELDQNYDPFNHFGNWKELRNISSSQGCVSIISKNNHDQQLLITIISIIRS